MVAMYLVMGWMFVVAVGPMINNLPLTSIIFLLLGGIFYSVGVIFYVKRNLIYGHGIWHLFVLAGSIMHFFAVIYSL
jgi:hemolysin III